MVSFSDIKRSEAVKAYIKKADESLLSLGYTEHSFPHVNKVADTVKYILSTLDFPERDIELGKIAAYLHDIGNVVNRIEHSQSGAIMSFRILDNMGMAPDEIATVITAIGNHDEGTGTPVNSIAAALILADKTDVRRSRVRNIDPINFDIHDRVNFSVEKSSVRINNSHNVITLKLDINTKYSSVMDYFEIFLQRMIMCTKAAEKLNMKFALKINDQQLL